MFVLSYWNVRVAATIGATIFFELSKMRHHNEHSVADPARFSDRMAAALFVSNKIICSILLEYVVHHHQQKVPYSIWLCTGTHACTYIYTSDIDVSM